MHTLLDADTSLLTPTDEPSLEFISSHPTNDRPASSKLPCPDIKTSTEAGTFASNTDHDPSTHFGINNNKGTSTTILAREQFHAVTSDPFYDEGEKDANGQVIMASREPCETCGGKVVFATKGEWLLICQGCQIPQ
ncbi:hypothetical protein EK21DRAFT_69382 [Setomelanomma holmii]|uniref:Uncharacterized protein n=1 Tax=Setomelanomma holmii TaxID=210430 RepID=A0A9P4LJ04_9PLEO|nr:hypothetical protein EK21DRAFT_69382 [Setomelanomma holmii]